MNIKITAQRQKSICLAVFVLYISIVLYLTIGRFNISYAERQLNLSLFADLIQVYRKVGLGVFLRLFLGNIGWFVPFGCLLPLLLEKKSFLLTLACAVGFSFFIETMQFLLYKGVAELDDLILNTCGAALGYWFYLALRKRFA